MRSTQVVAVAVGGCRRGRTRAAVVRQRTLLLVALAAAALSGGCSRFHRDWESRLQLDRANRPEGMAGCWSGTWTSETNGHHGGLRCIMTPRGDGRFSARFRATYCGILPFEQTVLLSAEERGGLWRFRGEENLGWLAGGVFTYEGEASGDRFMSRYTSASDRGVFEMARPQ